MFRGRGRGRGRGQATFHHSDTPTAVAQNVSYETSRDGRRIKVTKRKRSLSPEVIHAFDIEMGAPAPSDEEDNNMDFGHIDFDDAPPPSWPQRAAEVHPLAGGVEAVVKPKPREKESTLEAFIANADTFIDRTMLQEGRGPYVDSMCTGCQGPASATLYRCKVCIGGELWCSQCIVKEHRHIPFHSIECWDNATKRFHPTTLANLGLSIQLGRRHRPGESCPFRMAAHKDFTVIDNGVISPVNLWYCRCDDTPEYLQIIDMCWWPSTTVRPRTAATNNLLRDFHNLNMISNCTTYDYWRTLHVLTDNTGLQLVPHVLQPLTNMLRQWRYIKACRRCGRAHDPSGIAGTPDAGLAIECPACAQPGINLPEDWEVQPDAWKYTKKVGEDANFRQVSRLVGTLEKDPSMFNGKAYWVKTGPYNEYVLANTDEDEVSSCSEFHAMSSASMEKKWKGARSRGVGGLTCDHELWESLGMVDLPKGERFSSMTYAFMSALNATRAKMGLVRVLHTYDINCQFWKNFWERMEGLPLNMQRTDFELDSKIPKLHLYGHNDACQAIYALHFTKYAGQMDGEHVERLWSVLNHAAASAKEQGPGARQDQLNDLCGHHNYRKIQDFGNTFLRKMLTAIPMAVAHRRDFERFDDSLRKDMPEEVERWEERLAEWEADQHNLEQTKCPYVVSDAGQARAKLRLEIAVEEHEAVRSGGTLLEVTPHNFVQACISFQDRQRKLIADQRKEKARTTLQLAALEDQRKLLLVSLRRLRDQQAFYMPGLKRFVDVEELDEDGRTVEHLKVWLPSEIAEAPKAKTYLPGLADINTRIGAARCAACVEGLAWVEERIQEAEARDALDDLRNFLRIRTWIIHFKLNQLRGQCASTMAQAKKSRVDAQIFAAKNRYRAAWLALCRLRAGKGAEWMNELKELKDEDVRALNERELTLSEIEDRKRVQLLAARGQVEEEDDDADDGIDGERPGPEGVRLFGVLDAGESARRLSWIWMTVFTGNRGDPITTEALGVEWAKSKARSDRWLEQLIYIEEYMRRTLVTGERRARDWDGWADRRERERPPDAPALDAELSEGLRAYASEHADLERERVKQFREKWKVVRELGMRVIMNVDLESKTGVQQLQFLFDDLGLDDDMY